MARPDRIDDLDDVKTWIADHDGRIDAYWRAQHLWNDKQEILSLRLNDRMTALERKVMMFCGAASLAGALAGTLIPLLFRS